MSLPDSALTDPVSVVRGTAEPEELAALVAVLVSRSGRHRPAPPQPTQPGWSDRRATQRQPLRPGPGAWRAAVR